jgi:RecA-family ATPase
MIPVLTGEDYLKLPRTSETWLVKSLLPAGGSMILYGDPKVGKSYAALQLALAIQNGDPWLGFPVPNNGRVLYVQLDTPRSLWAERLEALKDVGHPVQDLLLADRETLETFTFDILNPEHFNLLKESVESAAPDCVIIDTLREAHKGDENDSTDMQNVISLLTSATQPAALVLISHSRKPAAETGPSLISDARGSGYIVGKMDTIMRFTKRSAYYTGRAIEEGSIHITRGDDGFWTPDNAEVDMIIAEILADTTLTSTRDRARKLASRINKSEESARSLLRRASLA